jgi:4'-phosphopantetheinyl transferase
MRVPPLGDAIRALAAALPATDRERAARFSRDDVRARYLAGRYALRTALGELLGVRPAELRFVRRCHRCGGTGHGKPALRWPGDERVDFNLAHSGALVAVAVVRGGRVGIDVERLRPGLDVLGVARLTFSADEIAEIEAISNPDERRAAFFRCWTRKEAYLKARADGLPGNLRTWSVSCSRAAVVVPNVPEDSSPGGHWQIGSLPLGTGYAGAVAYEHGTGSTTRPLQLHTVEWLEHIGSE